MGTGSYPPTQENLQMMEIPKRSRSSGLKKIWIDLDNSPHVPFFVPIMAELERSGYSVYLTARDCFQVCGLADLFHLPYRRVGRHYGKNKIMKALGTCYRSLQLLPTAFQEKPDLAISHGPSRSQLLAATIARIPSLIIFDYEFAKPVPGLAPTWVMIPELIPESSVQFATSRILRYPGIKEDVYVPNFKPDPSIKAQLGLDDNSTVVTLRPPANEAHYHNPDSEKLFDAVIDVLCHNDQTQVVLLPRNNKQAASVRKSWPDLFSRGKIMIPAHAIDGLNLIWYSDVVISGGGTMNREAAALGLPVYSIFRGAIGAVDQYLANIGRLVLLESVEDVRTKLILNRRSRPAHPEMATKDALRNIVNHIVAIMEYE
jgi:predicted glycosyltransferase